MTAIDLDKLRRDMEALDPDDYHNTCLTPIEVLALLDQIDQAETERDEWRHTAQEEHAAALDLIGVVKERDQRLEGVRDVLDRARDNFENVNDADIRHALDA